MCKYFVYGATTPTGPGHPHYRRLTITLRHATYSRTLLAEWSSRRRDLDFTTHKNTHNRQIRTRNPSKRAAADPSLRPLSHCDQFIANPYYNFTYFSGISYIDNTISIGDTSGVKREACIDLYIISQFVFTYKVFFWETLIMCLLDTRILGRLDVRWCGIHDQWPETYKQQNCVLNFIFLISVHWYHYANYTPTNALICY
jgi:hypothetical protein